MARYIKANPKVVEYLNLKNDRNAVKDGNYILWQSDMLAFGPLTRLAETLAAIGAIALMPHEAREEQDGSVTRPLPTATDERFIIPAASTPEAVEDESNGAVPGTDEAEQPGGDTAEGEATDTPETPTEETPEASENETENDNNEESTDK